jgi:hypothetical protein
MIDEIKCGLRLAPLRTSSLHIVPLKRIASRTHTITPPSLSILTFFFLSNQCIAIQVIRLLSEQVEQEGEKARSSHAWKEIAKPRQSPAAQTFSMDMESRVAETEPEIDDSLVAQDRPGRRSGDGERKWVRQM